LRDLIGMHVHCVSPISSQVCIRDINWRCSAAELVQLTIERFCNDVDDTNFRQLAAGVDQRLMLPGCEFLTWLLLRLSQDSDAPSLGKSLEKAEALLRWMNAEYSDELSLQSLYLYNLARPDAPPATLNELQSAGLIAAPLSSQQLQPQLTWQQELLKQLRLPVNFITPELERSILELRHCMDNAQLSKVKAYYRYFRVLKDIEDRVRNAKPGMQDPRVREAASAILNATLSHSAAGELTAQHVKDTLRKFYNVFSGIKDEEWQYFFGHLRRSSNLPGLQETLKTISKPAIWQRLTLMLTRENRCGTQTVIYDVLYLFLLNWEQTYESHPSEVTTASKAQVENWVEQRCPKVPETDKGQHAQEGPLCAL
jgi:hypothetical protein